MFYSCVSVQDSFIVMNKLQVPYNFVPRKYQLDLFRAMDGVAGRPETKKKRAFLRWHRRAGKDKCCLAYMFKEMVSRKGIYYYFLPNYQQGRKIIWEGIDKDGFKFLDHMPRDLVSRINNQEMMMELTNGSIFRVIGTDNIDTIVGTNPLGCVFSEYSLQDPQAWAFIRPILAENDGWAIFNGTPRGRNHMYELDKKVRMNYNWYYSELQTLWPDRPNYSGIVSQEAIQEERDSGYDEDTIEQEFGVSYSAGIKGSFYADQISHARAQGRIGYYPASDHLYVDTFWDLGKSDSTAIWFRQVDGRKIVWIDYWEGNKTEIPQIVHMLASKGYNYRTHYLPHDAEQERFGMPLTTAGILERMLKEAGLSDDIHIPHGSNGKIIRPRIQDGINAVRSRFSYYHFDEGRCMDAITMLELYHRRWDPKRQVFMKEPVHDWTSHCADALRLEAVVEEIAEDLEQFQPSSRIISDYDIFD